MPILRKEFVELIDERMKQLRYNPYDVMRVSGDRISHATVWNILHYQVKNVKDETVEILGEVLEIPRQKLFAIARGETERRDKILDRFADMSLKFEGLPEGEKMAMEDILAMVERELERRGRIKPKPERETTKKKK